MPGIPLPIVDATKPLYRRRRPIPPVGIDVTGGPDFINLLNVHLAPFDQPDPVQTAANRFDLRAAAVIAGAVGTINVNAQRFVPDGPGGGHFEPFDAFAELTETKTFGKEAPDVVIPIAESLAVIAYPDFFPGERDAVSLTMVSEAILISNPGWCGAFGPGVDDTFDLVLGDPSEGNYDLSQLHLVAIAYRHYDDLSPNARDHLINQLLARGRIHRPSLDDTFTSGGNPNDWARAGVVSPLGIKIRIGETENHVLCILTARYLTNQLLYQRDQNHAHDNRRNGDVMGGPNCMDLLLSLFRNILRDDFSEYNAKPYQTETHNALLNLCSYAYDHEVRLGARMVLDYISARLAVSSNDLRRMVPFRRRNENKNVTCDDRGFMDIGLLETTFGADPMAQHYAVLAGNTRIYEQRGWHVKTDGSDGNDAIMYALSDYRLPTLIHDLFVTDAHRRFFQHLHRTSQDDVELTGRNCDNQEIYAGSPSYLISAGGEFATWAINPGPVDLSEDLRKKNDQQLGVAVPSSFMPTTRPQADCGDPTSASSLIQFGSFSDVVGVFNYGVAPDFMCGFQNRLPQWCTDAFKTDSGDAFGKFEFVNRGSNGKGPGFYLAFIRDGDGFAVMEAFDTWLHPGLTFEQFRLNVFVENKDLMENGLQKNVVSTYRTQNRAILNFTIFDLPDGRGAHVGAPNLTNSLDADVDIFGNAGDSEPGRFLSGSVLNSKADGVVEITNLFLKQTLTLDMQDPNAMERVSETEFESAGGSEEVWVDFAWSGPKEGDFFHPFNTLAGAFAAVSDGGVVRVKPGITSERPVFSTGKQFTVLAPGGGVAFGVR